VEGAVEDPWREFRWARRVFVLATVVALCLLAGQRLRLVNRLAGWLTLSYFALAAFMFWSVWRLERCQRDRN